MQKYNFLCQKLNKNFSNLNGKRKYFFVIFNVLEKIFEKKLNQLKKNGKIRKKRVRVLLDEILPEAGASRKPLAYHAQR